MATNQYKETKDIEEEKPKKGKIKQRENVITKFIFSLFNGTILTRQKVIRTLPFLFFLTMLAVIYITNSYYAEKTIRNIEKTKSELKELRTEHISVKSELMFKSKQSEVAVKLIQYGIKESVIPPIKIFIPKDSIKSITK
jgi:hypothetical protein